MSSNFNVLVQSDTSNDQKIMLKQFYIAYNTAWSTSTGNVLVKKLDSLQDKYCALKLRRKLKRNFEKFGLDHDYLINDQYTDIIHLKTLNVTKDLKPDIFIVSYIVHTLSASNKPVDIKIIIHVRVIKEGRQYKIASTDMS